MCYGCVIKFTSRNSLVAIAKGHRTYMKHGQEKSSSEERNMYCHVTNSDPFSCVEKKMSITNERILLDRACITHLSTSQKGIISQMDIPAISEVLYNMSFWFILTYMVNNLHIIKSNE